jgi:acetyl-CoA synthetase
MGIPSRIVKQPGLLRPAPNLADHAAVSAAFSWQSAAAGLARLPGGGVNMAHEAVDRHLAEGRADRVALRWLGKSGQRREFSYSELSAHCHRFAHALHSLGVGKGERVFLLLGRLPELYFALVGGLAARCVVSPLFSAFGPEPIATRCEIGDARVLVTTPELYRRKVAGLRERLPGLRHVILVGDPGPELPGGPGLWRWSDLVDTASSDYAIGPTTPEDMALLHFTSGTTGRPKGAVHVHGAVLAHQVTGRYALDLHDDDRFWCTADPGWITGTSYGVLAPLCNGVTSVVVEAEFDA